MEAAPTGTAKPKPKRKRGTDDDVAAPSSAAAAIAEVSDAEVEEFCAILRRIRDASRARRLRFSREDFAPPQQPAPVAGNGTARRGLDLNAEPEPEAPAAGEPTRLERTN